LDYQAPLNFEIMNAA